jgi:hypothetical protein
MDQYITLPSQAVGLSVFRTTLSREIDTTDCEVGLADITYTKSFSNVPTDQDVSIMIYDPNEPTLYREENLGKIHHGEYTIEGLIDSINVKVDKRFQEYLEFGEHCRFPLLLNEGPRVSMHSGVSFNRSKNKADKRQQLLVYAKPSELLCTLLGYDLRAYEGVISHIFSLVKKYSDENEGKDHPNLLEFDKIRYISKHPDLNGPRVMYLLTNIAEARSVGSAQFSVLRVVDIPSQSIQGQKTPGGTSRGEFGSQITKSYGRVQYAKVMPLRSAKLRSC